MKSKLYYLLILLLTSQLTFAGNEWNGRHTKEKTIKKEYTVNRDALLKISNSYGNINIITYSGNTVSIEVNIKTNGNNLEKVQEKLDEITVDFQASSSIVSAKTIFGKNKSGSWWSWGRNTTVNMEINYLVKLPMSNSVDLNNDYGSINLDRLEGHAKINCDYGKITTKELMADNNLISFDYTNNSYFEYIKSGKINADYSSFTVAKTKNLDINADYTKSMVEIAEDVSYTCDYGSVTVQKANNVKGNGDYLTARFGEIYKNIQITADYGSIKIDKLTKNAGNVSIDADYTGVTIGYDSGYQFKFDIKLEYASLRGDEDFQFLKKKVESTNKYYQGYHGDANANNLIKITSDYGSVTFKRN
ncbi:hypothetical protein [Gelidibacter gilvus]|uniref:Adhesin domain-containing protein n=1 Tax=Gelidibacter gilvus TaxID=59602 RepID=A0A4Q0XJC8_9FLAO|nr:hypothetical protein [Gelidibacter gilvus]RXJ51371.1 hypothetical protein ESZ48_05750 [Gelidibacter gilvus]